MPTPSRPERSSSAKSSGCVNGSPPRPGGRRLRRPCVMDERALAGRERPSFAETADIDEFVETLERFERGEISAETWRKFRLVRGTYGQRQDDVQMLRVKIPQGALTALQVESLA